MKEYVMFGHNHLLGDWIEIIHANEGVLTKIVQNVPEIAHSNRPSLQERLSRLQDDIYNNQGVNQFHPVEVQALRDFVPQPNENYVIGFTGFKQKAVIHYLRTTFDLHFTTLIHPTAIVSPTAHIAAGVIINAGSIIASGVSISEHVAINKGVIIGHDTELFRYVVVQPGVKLGGHIYVGQGSVIGIGAIAIEDINVGEYAMAAAGAVVIQDIPAHTLVAGVPATIKKKINLDQKT
jgi:sugar O-acyltransferase (sialic acid O-acetyltransferase NeuD family)